MPDPITVEAVLYYIRKGMKVPKPLHAATLWFADAVADSYEKKWRHRNPWKRPPWQIGRRQNAKQVKR